MTGHDPNRQTNVETTTPNTTPQPASPPAEDAGQAAEADDSSRRQILIGSQRDPAAYRRRRRRDWTPVAGGETKEQDELEKLRKRRRPRRSLRPIDPGMDNPLSDASLDALMLGGQEGVGGEPLEPKSQHTGRVAAVRRGEVFVDLGGREQGCLPLRQFESPPKPGNVLQVIVQKLNPDDGLYELRLPGRAVEVADWSDLNEGMLVDAQVTGHNAGGLECEVDHIRGFIPVSQVSLYRVEDLAQFVGQRMTCLIAEANPAGGTSC